MLPKCVKLLDHYMADQHGAPYKVDATHKPPDPGFNTGLDPINFEQALAAAIHSPRPELAAILHRNAKPGKPIIPDVQSFADLRNDPYRLSIALADMTGDPSIPTSKFNQPMYAAYFDKESIYPASLAKLAPIYTIHQLKYDAIQKAATAPASAQGDKAKLTKWVFDALRTDWKGKGLKLTQQPVLKYLLEADDAGQTMVFTDLCIENFGHITHPTSFSAVDEMNHAMTALVTSVHAAYMGSVFLQAGLCKEDQGGMWIYEAWGEKWNCDGSVPQLYPKQPGTEIMAWSAATCLALLAQERLVSPTISKELKTVLNNGDTNWLKNGFDTAFKANASEVTKVDVWGKEGAWGGFASEALVIERTNSANKTYRYVVACLLSSTAPVSQYPVALAETDPHFRHVWDVLLRAIVESIIPGLDAVIVGNNP